MPLRDRDGILIVRIIHRWVWVLAFSFSVAYTLYAQEPSRKELRDTLVKKALINQSLLRSFQIEIIPSPSLRDSPEYLPMSLHQALTILPTSLSGQFQQQIDLVSPWKQELAKQNELHTLKIILGAVQAGGTTYLLYEHIKKYGLK
ncbi:MAG: hypothetical protein ABSC53_03570 [Bacteroidota bacterium]